MYSKALLSFWSIHSLGQRDKFPCCLVEGPNTTVQVPQSATKYNVAPTQTPNHATKVPLSLQIFSAFLPFWKLISFWPLCFIITRFSPKTHLRRTRSRPLPLKRFYICKFNAKTIVINFISIRKKKKKKKHTQQLNLWHLTQHLIAHVSTSPLCLHFSKVSFISFLHKPPPTSPHTGFLIYYYIIFAYLF